MKSPNDLQTTQVAELDSFVELEHEARGTLSLRSFLPWMVVLLSGSYTFLDYWNYSRDSRLGASSEWASIVQGQYYAPEQYRIGVIRMANLMASVSHTHFRHMFALIDFVAVVISLSMLLWLLTDSALFHKADQLGQWLQVFILLGSATLYLMWSFWYQKPETQTSLLLLVLSIAVTLRQKMPALGAVALILLAAIGALVRADSVCALNVGFLVVCLMPVGRTLALGRALQAAASSLAILCAISIEWYISHRIYPYAPRINPAFQLLANLKNGLFYLVIPVSLFPWIITIVLAARRWRLLEGWMIAALIGSLVEFCLFYTFGIAWEVRIFLPFATTLLPVTAILGYQAIAGLPMNKERWSADLLD